MLINEKNPHGGQIYNKEIKADFSVNVNPKGTPEKVVEAAAEALRMSDRYPDAGCRDLIQAISKKDGVQANNIICGNGGAELIFQVAAALKPKKGLIIEPTFCEYRQSLEASECQIKTYQLTKETGFDVNAEIERIREQIEEDTDVVFVCNPNNPTGLSVSGENIEKLLKRCNETGTMLFIDESFGELTEGYEKFSAIKRVAENKNLFILKSLTKTYAIAGIRLGYGLCSDKELLEKMCRMSQCWNVSLVAQKAGEAALSCSSYVEDTLIVLRNERKYVTDELNRLGIRTFRGEANYMMIYSESDLYELLLKKGILIRSCANFRGLGKNYFRIAIKNHVSNKLLIDALDEIDKEGNLCTGQA